ncbi:MAG TPA: flagellar protein FlaG [Campylobacterales bacterium]|nr:flagellar protein FlaG [Campylobacterales bacterium]
MASNTTGVGSGLGGADYNYAYTKPIQSEQKIKEDTKQESISEVKTASIVAPQTLRQTQKNDDAKESQEVKTIYEEELEADKKAEEEKKRQREEEARSERMQELTDELNKRMNSFSENIKFGINDKSNSIVVSVIEQNNEKKIKELSKEDAEKLFKRLDYVLGVLFDSKG